MKNFFVREDGQSLIEYTLIAALVSIVVIGALKTLGKSIDTKLNNVSGVINAANSETAMS